MEPEFLEKGFTILHDKSLRPNIVALNPTMDLLAASHVTSLAIYRTSQGWVRTCMLRKSAFGDDWPITALVWSPDGRTLCVGHKTGALTLIAAETGEKEGIFRDLHSSAITAMTWAAQETPERVGSRNFGADAASEAQGRYFDRCGHFLGETGADLKQTEAAATAAGSEAASPGPVPSKALQMAQMAPERALCILASADESGKVVLSVHGVFRIASLHLSQITASMGGAASASKAKAKATAPESAPAAVRPLQLAFSRDLKVLSAIWLVGGSNLHWQLLPLPLLWRRRYDLRRMAACYAAVSSCLSRLEHSVAEAGRQWDVVLKELRGRFGLLGRALADRGAPVTSPRDELLAFLATGCATPALRHFFEHHLSENPMSRLQKAVDAAAAAAEAALRDAAPMAARQLIFRAADLSAVVGDWVASSAQEAGENMSRELKGLRDGCADTCIAVELALRRVREGRARAALLLDWIARATSKPTDSARPGRLEKLPPNLPLLKSVQAFLLPSNSVAADFAPLDLPGDTLTRFSAGASIEQLLGTEVRSLLVRTGGRQSAAGAAPSGSGAAGAGLGLPGQRHVGSNALPPHRQAPAGSAGFAAATTAPGDAASSAGLSLEERAAALRVASEAVFAAAQGALDVLLAEAAAGGGFWVDLGAGNDETAVTLHSCARVALPGFRDPASCLLVAVAPPPQEEKNKIVWVLAVPSAFERRRGVAHAGSSSSTGGDCASDSDSCAEDGGAASAEFKLSNKRDEKTARQAETSRAVFAAPLPLAEGRKVCKLAFYGLGPGVQPPPRSQSQPEQLTLLLGSAAPLSESSARRGGDYAIASYPYLALDFVAAPVAWPNARGWPLGLVTAAAARAAEAAGVPVPDARMELWRMREFSSLVRPALAVSAGRAAICLHGRPASHGGPNRLLLLDAENDDEEAESDDGMVEDERE